MRRMAEKGRSPAALSFFWILGLDGDEVDA